MSRVPRIDTPCPLDARAQSAIDGHCTRCDKTVHRLDNMSNDARKALMATATGPICVSYRMPAAHRVGRIGAVIAATLITATAYANDPAPKQVDRVTATTGTRIPDQTVREMDEVAVIGAVSDPQDAAVPEDVSVPVLPAREATARSAPPQKTTGSRIPDQKLRELDEVMVIGAVNDPQDAAIPEDHSVPELPVRDVQTALAQVAPEETDQDEIDQDEIMLLGGVSDPGNADWEDVDTSLPELPVVAEKTTGPRR